MARKKIVIKPRQPNGAPPAKPSGQGRITVRRSSGKGGPNWEDKHTAVTTAYQRLRQRVIWGGGAVLGVLLIVGAIWWLQPDPPQEPIEQALTGATRYGFDMTPYEPNVEVIRPGQSLEDIFTGWGVGYSEQEKLFDAVSTHMDPANIAEGGRLTILTTKDQQRATKVLIYEPDPYSYVVFDLRDTVAVRPVKRTIFTKMEVGSGVIDSVLWRTMLDRNLNYDLITKMEEALAYVVDFYHIKPNNRFKLLYDGIYADGELVGVGTLHAAYFETDNQAFTAIYDEVGGGYFDPEARPMKRSFLLSPVKYARISSPFNLTRYHPVLERVKPHLGTDYAAPEGTPILAVADGIITRARFGKNNGNNVKIQHDNTYTTQYLHLSKFEEGIKVGTPVKQGEIIGYVGSTGLSSGPHVCFRFWKNEKQVNHLTENLPSTKPLRGSLAEAFMARRDTILPRLEAVSYY